MVCKAVVEGDQAETLVEGVVLVGKERVDESRSGGGPDNDSEASVGASGEGWRRALTGRALTISARSRAGIVRLFVFILPLGERRAPLLVKTCG